VADVLVGRRLSVLLTACVAAFATGMASSQVSVSLSAFTDQTGTGSDSWSAGSLAPVSGLVADDTCASSGAPQVVASTSANDISGAVVLSVPAVAAAGDLLVAQLVNDGSSSAAPGFSLLLDTTATGGDFQGRIYQRVAQAGDAGTAFSFPVSKGKAGGTLLVVRGAAGPIVAGEAAGTATGTKTSTLVAPSVDVGVPGSLLLSVYGLKNAGRTFSTPTGMTQVFAFPAPKDVSQAGFSEVRTATGATGTRTSTASSSDENVSQSAVIRPDGTEAEVTLSWTPSTSAFATGYSVVRDGTPVASLSGVATSSWTDPSPLDGSHTYEVRVVAGSWQSTPVAAVAVVDCAPTVAVTPLPTYVRGTVEVAATADSSQGVTSVAIQRAPAGTGTWTTLCTDTTAPWSCPWTTTTTADGLYDLRATVLDGAGRTATSTTVQTRVDNTAPAVTMNDPGTPLTAPVTLTSTASDAGSGVATVEFQLSASGSGLWSTACTATLAPWSCLFDPTAHPDGYYDLRAVATDAAGNTRTSTTVLNRQFGNAPPSTFSAIGPVSTRTSSGSATVQYPVGTEQGDLVLLVQANQADQAITTPTGWAVVADQRMTSPQQFRFTVWSRTAGTETSVTLNTNTNASGTSLWVVRYDRPTGAPAATGAHTAVRQGQAGAVSTLTPSPDVTTTDVSTVVSIVAIRAENPLSLQTPQGFVLRGQSLGLGVALGVADQPVSSALTVPSPTWAQTGTAGQWGWVAGSFR
jgi:hypothetical protein